MTFLKFSRVFKISLAVMLISMASAHAESLDVAVGSALMEHPSVEAARADLQAADETKREERSGYFPELSVNTTTGRIFGDNSTSRGLSVTRGSGYSYLWEGGVTARQMLFDGFETKNRLDSAKAKYSSADLSVVDVRETLALRAVQAYIDVMRSHEGLSMLQDQQSKVADYLQRIKTSVDEGTSDDAEYQQARDVKVILDGFIADYRGQVMAAEAQYFEAVGRMPQGDMSVPSPDLSSIPQDPREAMQYVMDNHPSLLAAAYSAKSAEYDIAGEEALLYPDVNGELSYLKSDKDDVIGGELIDAKAVVRMNWNFETGGAQLARIQKKRHEHQSSMSRMQELKRQIEAGVRFSFADLRTAKTQLANQKKRQELNKQLFNTYEIQFEGARISLLQLMQADNQVFNTELERMSAEYRVLASQYALLASMGRLQSSLNLDAGQLQAAVYE